MQGRRSNGTKIPKGQTKKEKDLDWAEELLNPEQSMHFDKASV